MLTIRRQYAVVALIGLIVLMSACSTNVGSPGKESFSISKDGPWTSINDEIFISTGNYYDVNVTLVTSGKEATLIDTGYNEEEGLRIKEYIEKNDLILKNIIITNMAKDRVGNLKMFKNPKTNIVSPMKAQHNQIIQMGDKKFKILSTSEQNASKHICIELNENILFAGDIVKTDKDIPLVMTSKNFPSLIKTLEDIKEKNYSLIIPAYGAISENGLPIDEYFNTLKGYEEKFNITQEGQLQVINNEIFVSTGDYAQVIMVLVTSGNEATLIDTGNNNREAFVVKQYIEDNHLQLKNIIITHEHQDHINNLDMFLSDNVSLYTYDTIENNQVVPMGNKSFKILMTPGHFEDKHISIEVNQEILISGDILSTNIPPSELLQYGGNHDKLIKTLEELKKNNYALIIPGHGDLCIGSRIIQDHLDTLQSYGAK